MGVRGRPCAEAAVPLDASWVSILGRVGPSSLSRAESGSADWGGTPGAAFLPSPREAQAPSRGPPPPVAAALYTHHQRDARKTKRRGRVRVLTGRSPLLLLGT